MADLLLVTGSRSLQRYPEAEQRARAILRHALSTARLLVVGDASGPDTWAREEAASLVVEYLVYALDGHARFYDRGECVGVKRWHTGHIPRDRRFPLTRNNAMVLGAVVEAEIARVPSRCLALIDPGSRTQGTAHTARLARAAGIPTVEVAWAL